MELPDFKNFLPGALGSFGAALFFMKGSAGRRVGLGVFGSFLAYYGSPYISQTLNMSEGLAGLMLGLFGMSVVDSIFKSWQERGLPETIRDFWQALRGKE